MVPACWFSICSSFLCRLSCADRRGGARGTIWSGSSPALAEIGNARRGSRKVAYATKAAYRA
jgi:hypothetical protein